MRKKIGDVDPYLAGGVGVYKIHTLPVHLSFLLHLKEKFSSGFKKNFFLKIHYWSYVPESGKLNKFLLVQIDIYRF